MYSTSTDPNDSEAYPQRYFISAPTKALIHRLSEVGYLYTRIESFVRNSETAMGVGMIEQSLCHHLQSQLTEYYRLIAILESQMTSKPSQPDELGPADNQHGESGLTLRRLDAWINDWRLRMRMMSVCVESARGEPFVSYLYIFLPCLQMHTGVLL